MIRVIVCDDHHLVRQGIRSLLEREDDMFVVAEAADGHEAVEQVEKHTPDVLVLDLSMPRLNGVQTAHQLRQRGLSTNIIITSVHTDKYLILQALKAGVKGYLLKSAFREELILAVRAAKKGHSYISPEISQTIVFNLLADNREHKQPSETPLDELTPREQEILKLIAEEYTSSEISDILRVSPKTIQKHRANLMAKLDVHNIAGLTKLAVKYGLVHLE